ncbi:SRPBCC family protein [Streptomyces sp. PRKS01-29]|nr:SRPBCC family protein [Streptomyces sabulosicollis]MBI0299586.1 SRPBCC family protein [Streptomyces sabulosicollis]
MAEETKGRTGERGALARELPTDRLLKEAQSLLAALGERALESVTHLGNPGTGALKGGLEQVRDKVADTAKDQVKDQVKEKVKGQFKEKVVDKAKSIIPGLGGGDGDGGKGGKKLKVTNIVEQMDVGAPLSLTYNLWTEWENFPSYMKKVEAVRNEDEDEVGTESEWKAQVFWSHRKWRAEVIEQVPDKRIIWKSRAEKGHVDGTITFHELAPDLTRILFVLEYWPQGFMERTGNLWRAQGRRVRLEMKHFRRHLMREVLLDPDQVVGWRGVVRDGEIVEDDEREGRESEEEPEEPEEGEAEEEGDERHDEYEDEEHEEPEEYEDEEPRDEDEEEYEDEEPVRRRARR